MEVSILMFQNQHLNNTSQNIHVSKALVSVSVFPEDPLLHGLGMFLNPVITLCPEAKELMVLYSC